MKKKTVFDLKIGDKYYYVNTKAHQIDETIIEDELDLNITLKGDIEWGVAFVTKKEAESFIKKLKIMAKSTNEQFNKDEVNNINKNDNNNIKIIEQINDNNINELLTKLEGLTNIKWEYVIDEEFQLLCSEEDWVYSLTTGTAMTCGDTGKLKVIDTYGDIMEVKMELSEFIKNIENGNFI